LNQIDNTYIVSKTQITTRDPTFIYSSFGFKIVFLFGVINILQHQTIIWDQFCCQS